MKPGNNLSEVSQNFLHDEPTHSAPMKSMRDPVFLFVWVWRYSLGDMLSFGVMGIGTTAKVNMDMSSHRHAHHIAQHRATVVVRGEFASFQLDASIVRTLDSPPGLRHRSVARLVFLLRMPCAYDQLCATEPGDQNRTMRKRAQIAAVPTPRASKFLREAGFVSTHRLLQ